MSVRWKESDQTLPLPPVSSQRQPDTISIDMDMSTVQQIMANHVTNQVVTNTKLNFTNPPIADTSTNPGASGHPIHHEWAWF